MRTSDRIVQLFFLFFIPFTEVTMGSEQKHWPDHFLVDQEEKHDYHYDTI